METTKTLCKDTVREHAKDQDRNVSGSEQLCHVRSLVHQVSGVVRVSQGCRFALRNEFLSCVCVLPKTRHLDPREGRETHVPQRVPLLRSRCRSLQRSASFHPLCCLCTQPTLRHRSRAILFQPQQHRRQRQYAHHRCFSAKCKTGAPVTDAIGVRIQSCPISSSAMDADIPTMIPAAKHRHHNHRSTGLRPTCLKATAMLEPSQTP